MAADFSNIFATVLGRVRAVNDALIASGALPALDQSRVLVETRGRSRASWPS
jgi:hypothetical protein